MAIILGNTADVIISIEVPSDSDVDIIQFAFPPRNDSEFKKHQRILLKGRWRMSGSGTPLNVSTEARVAFFDATCKDILSDNVNVKWDGALVPLNKDTQIEAIVANGGHVFLDLIPDEWKIQVASEFEETAVKIRRQIEKD